MRRLLPWLVVLALPVASAGAFSLPTGRIAEATGAPGGDVLFEIPVVAEQDGLLYAKVLPTPGNAVDDGSGPNGSVEKATGWRVSFALARADASVEGMGTFADGSMSRLVPIRAGERMVLRATVHVPADALSGGALQRVYVALAYRDAPAGADPGASSGAQMDTARALTLVARLSGTAVSLPPAPPGGEGSGSEDTDVPPVAPIDLGGAEGRGETRVVVVQQEALPTWFLGGLLAVLSALALVGGVIAYALLATLRDARRAGSRVHVAVRAAEPGHAPRQAEAGMGRP